MDGKDHKDLIDFIGGQFNRVDKQFDRVWVEFGDLKKDFRELQSAVDTYAHKADTYFMEIAALGNKLDRHERWIHMIAEKMGITLPS